MRWLAAKHAPARDEAAKWRGLPYGAAAALVFAWGTSCKTSAVAAVSLLAVTAAAERVAWFRTRAVKVRMIGSRRGTVFQSRHGEPAASLHIAEGEIDALALSLAPWVGAGRVLAIGGTAGLRHVRKLGSGPVVLHCDGDRGGREAALQASNRLRGAGLDVRINWCAAGTDPAGALAEWLCERAAVREFDGGKARADADRGAWRDLMVQAAASAGGVDAG